MDRKEMLAPLPDPALIDEIASIATRGLGDRAREWIARPAAEKAARHGFLHGYHQALRALAGDEQ